MHDSLIEKVDVSGHPFTGQINAVPEEKPCFVRPQSHKFSPIFLVKSEATRLLSLIK